jgi:hypothetical protein
METKNLSKVLLMIFALSMVSFLGVVNVAAVNSTEKATGSDWDLEGISGTPSLRGVTYEGIEVDTGNTWTVAVIDDFYGGFYYQDFECVFQGTYGNIWIGLSPDVWSGGYQDEYVDNGPAGYSAEDVWYFAYPWSDVGLADGPSGYYLYPGYRDWITGENLLYVLDEFDNNIHDKVVSHFGMYADRPGPLDDYKIQILIFNIRDGLFYDPVNAPWFIAGYFWSYASYINNANIFHMDTYQWWRRLGDDPQCPPPYEHLSPKPNQYEGTFAHEFQHLVHRDVDPDEMSWINEGCSMLAEWICGYGFSPGHISEYLWYWWDTSLVIWQGYLSNYGVVMLWTYYMYEHYGGAPLIWDLVHEQANGIAGWENVLSAHGVCRSFDQIFQDWAIANYLDNTDIAGGRYGYYGLDIPSADTEGVSLPYTIWYWEAAYPGFFDTQVDSYPNHGYNYPWGASLPYQVNYVEFYGNGLVQFDFDGADVCGVPAYSGTYEWYSDGTAYSWFRLSQPFTIPAGGATLTFQTYYEIEGDWDYGYVEVHDLDTDEWYTLPGLGTVTTLPNPQDNPNCPDDVEPTAYEAAGRWNAFTGYSGGWYQEVMDLSMFAGHDIELYFTYWTDPYTLELGWYIDDIEILEIGFFDDVESGEGDWVVNDGWYVTDGVILNDFEVSFVEINTFFDWYGNPYHTYYYISQLGLDDDTEEGRKYLRLKDTWRTFTFTLMVAANQPGYEHTFLTYYDFTADHFNWWFW